MENNGGAEGSRTPDLYNAIVALSQLSYGPMGIFAATDDPAARSNAYRNVAIRGK
jgi:hypothetical protein